MTERSQEMTRSDPSLPVDVAIIGAGPVGLFSVFACGMLGLKTSVFDVLDQPGGQCRLLYPEKPIYDIPGFASITAESLIMELLKQAAPFSPDYHFNTPVSDISFLNEPDLFSITTKTGVFYARSILLTTGGGLFEHKRPPLDGIEKYENKSVFYTVQRIDDFTNKTIVITGGGDSALDWANILAPKTRKIYLVHRRDSFRARADTLKTLDHFCQLGSVEKIIPFQLAELKETGGTLSHVVVKNLDGVSRTLETDVLLCFYGLSTNPGVVATIGLEIENGSVRINPTTGATNKKGIYAAGDIATYPHKRKLIATGFFESLQSAQSIYAFLYPDRPLHIEHSTTKGVPVFPRVQEN